MTRRLTLTILGSILATLVLAGFGTLALARFGAKQATRDQLVDQTQALTTAIEGSGMNLSFAARRQQLALLVRALRLEGIGFAVLGPGGQPALDAGGNGLLDLPDGVSSDDLHADRLLAGETVTGSHGSLVYAAAPANRGPVTVVVIATRAADTQLGPAFRWFLLAAAATLVVGALVAARLGRRLTEPLRAASSATSGIAQGDLGTRLPDPPGAAHDEVSDLARSINAMAAALERSQGLERQFLLSVSHDLRTPLTSIRGYAEAITDGAAPEPAAAARVILGEARRLERLVGDLLDLARLDARTFRLDLRDVDLLDVAGGTVDGFQPDAAAAGVHVRVEASAGAAGGVVVRGDPDRLAQVAANLVENALKFATTEVAVRVDSSEGWGWLVVGDDGAGIAPDDLPHVFERLYVASREPRRKETGSGLGLAIVRELVAAMGGHVTAQARAGGGTDLVVALPLAPDEK